MKDYKHFNATDFFLDDEFYNWVKNPDAKADLFWKNWSYAHPEMMDVIAEARAYVLSIQFVAHTVADADIQRAFVQHQQTLRDLSVPVAKIKPVYKWLSIAALWILLFSAAGFIAYQMYMKGTVTYQTRYGEMLTVTLPDSSIVTLQSNSKMTRLRDWSENRRVSLEGEAYFKVKHFNKNPLMIKNGERFTVQTPNLSVVVLGTTFNVKARRNISKVYLKEGAVAVRLKHRDSAIPTNSLLLKPAQQLIFSPDQKAGLSIENIKKDDEQRITGWLQKNIVFNGLSMHDLFDYMQDNYGYQIKVTDANIYKLELSGKLKLENENDLFFILNTILNLKTEKNGKQITISKKH